MVPYTFKSKTQIERNHLNKFLQFTKNTFFTLHVIFKYYIIFHPTSALHVHHIY